MPTFEYTDACAMDKRSLVAAAQSLFDIEQDPSASLDSVESARNDLFSEVWSQQIASPKQLLDVESSDGDDAIGPHVQVAVSTENDDFLFLFAIPVTAEARCVA